MENKVIVISASELVEYLQPILLKMEKMEAILLEKHKSIKAVFSDSEAASRMQTKPLFAEETNPEKLIGGLQFDVFIFDTLELFLMFFESLDNSIIKLQQYRNCYFSILCYKRKQFFNPLGQW